jgi:hypothetical protein
MFLKFSDFFGDVKLYKIKQTCYFFCTLSDPRASEAGVAAGEGFALTFFSNNQRWLKLLTFHPPWQATAEDGTRWRSKSVAKQNQTEYSNQLAAETILKGKELGRHFSQGLPELCQFFFRAVNFQTREFGDLQGFLQQGTDISKMGENPFGILIAFTAVDLVAIETESVIQAFGLRAGFFNELFAHFFEGPKFAALNLEIGYDRTTFVLGCHSFLLWISNFIWVFFPIDISTLDGDKMAGTFPAVVAGSAILPGSAI